MWRIGLKLIVPGLGMYACGVYACKLYPGYRKNIRAGQSFEKKIVFTEKLI